MGTKSNFWEGPTYTTASRKRLTKAHRPFVSPPWWSWLCGGVADDWGGAETQSTKHSSHKFQPQAQVSNSPSRPSGIPWHYYPWSFLQCEFELGKEVSKVKGAFSQVCTIKITSSSPFLSWTYSPSSSNFQVFLQSRLMLLNLIWSTVSPIDV